MAIPDQVISTKEYIVDTCGVRGKKPETIQHIITGYEALANVDYTERHNNAGKMLHRALVLKYKMKTVVESYNKYEPKKMLENDRVTVTF